MAKARANQPGVPAGGGDFIPDRRGWLRIAGIAIAYFAATKLGLEFQDSERVLAAVWPAAGVGLAALLLFPRRQWPALAATILLAGNAANLLSGRPLLLSLCDMAANVCESLACAWLMTAWRDEPVWFATVRDVAHLIFAATVVNAATSLLGAGAAKLAGIAPFWSFWKTWFVADGLGLLLVTPLIVVWSDRDISIFEAFTRKLAETCLFLLLWSALTWYAFQPHAMCSLVTPQPYMLLALLAWPALRLGRRVVTLSLVVLAGVALTNNLDFEPLAATASDPTQRILMIQLFLGFLTATSLLLTASFSERKLIEQELENTRHTVQSTLDGLTANIALLNEHGDIVLVNKAWRDHALEDTLVPDAVSEGISHLQACSASSLEDAGEGIPFAEGIRKALAGELESYSLEYPCHTQERRRWFAGRVSPFPGKGPRRVIVVQEDITERVEARQAMEETNRILETLSVTDSLTHLANRRQFDAVLAREYTRHARSKAPLSVIMLDIDLFKSFNDTYGHLKGDECLQQVAAVLVGCAARPADLAARFGGEEFTCILPETDLEGAIIVAEHIRAGIRDLAIPHETSTVADRVTASLGVVTAWCTSQGSESDVVARADELLYRAKTGGRDRLEYGRLEAEADVVLPDASV